MSEYSLWRDDTLLGRFAERAPVLHHGRRVGASGILEPSPAFVGIGSVMQTRIPIFPGQPVFQDPLEPEHFAVTTPDRHHKGPQALLPISEEEARGVAPNLVFEVRDAGGNPVNATMVLIQLHVIPDGADPETTSEATTVGSSRQFWHVTFAVHDGAA